MAVHQIQLPLKGPLPRTGKQAGPAGFSQRGPERRGSANEFRWVLTEEKRKKWKNKEKEIAKPGALYITDTPTAPPQSADPSARFSQRLGTKRMDVSPFSNSGPSGLQRVWGNIYFVFIQRNLISYLNPFKTQTAVLKTAWKWSNQDIPLCSI